MKRVICVCLALLMTAAALCFTPVARAETLESVLGKPFPDFSVTTIDGRTFSLSETLKEKELVLIDYFATWCGPCRTMFPYMQQAWKQYSDSVAVLALSVEPTDTVEKLSSFCDQLELELPVGNLQGTGIENFLSISAIPVRVAIDRFGNVVYAGAGALTSSSMFSRLFEAFLGEEYTETVTYTEIPQWKLNTEYPDNEELSAALSGAEGEALAFVSDRATFPWVPGVYDGRACVLATNMEKPDSEATMRCELNAPEGAVLAFDCACELQPMQDVFGVFLDEGTAQEQLLKVITGSRTWRGFAVKLPAGEHTLSFRFLRGSAEAGEDFGIALGNARLLTGEAGQAALAAMPVYPAADASGISVVNANARQARLMYNGSDVGYVIYVVNDNWAQLRVSLEAGADPEYAALVTGATGKMILLDTLLDAEAGVYSYTAEIPENEPFEMVGVVIPAADGGETLEALLVRSEQGMTYFPAYFAQNGYNGVTWEYVERAPEETAEEEAGAGAYVVRVVDQHGAPVPEVYVNMCTDDACTLLCTGEDGTVRFESVPYNYHVEVVSAPDGYTYSADNAVYTGMIPGEVVVQITKE